MHTLIEVVADDPETLEQRGNGCGAAMCVGGYDRPPLWIIKTRQAFLSMLPLSLNGPRILNGQSRP